MHDIFHAFWRIDLGLLIPQKLIYDDAFLGTNCERRIAQWTSYGAEIGPSYTQIGKGKLDGSYKNAE